MGNTVLAPLQEMSITLILIVKKMLSSFLLCIDSVRNHNVFLTLFLLRFVLFQLSKYTWDINCVLNSFLQTTLFVKCTFKLSNQVHFQFYFWCYFNLSSPKTYLFCCCCGCLFVCLLFKICLIGKGNKSRIKLLGLYSLVLQVFCVRLHIFIFSVCADT